MGNRVGITVNGATCSFIYDPTAGVPAVLEENRPGGVVVRYYRTPDGALIARRNGSDWRYYHYDELGSTRLLTDGSGNVTDTYSYDPWGNTISHVGSTTDNPYQYVGALGYYTHWQSPDVKLLQLGFRFYDPEIGRFTQLDPIKDGLNWYEYNDSNPPAWTDPWGLTSLTTAHQQYNKIKKILAFEAKYGTTKAILKYNNTMSSCKPNDDRLGDEFDDQCTNKSAGEKDHGVYTVAGYLDLDWWAECLYWTDYEWIGPSTVYYAGKGLWRLLGRGSNWFADKKERTAVDALNRGYLHFRNLFTPQFMDTWAKQLRRADADFARAKKMNRKLSKDRVEFIWDDGPTYIGPVRKN
jgi:RHS repeat-associated protein